jgi:hypothetical protein
MKQKILFLFILASFFSFSSMAQLTTGKSSANVIRNGNRASEGDFGLYFGATSNIFTLRSDLPEGADLSVSFLPLVNLKYMATDNIEWRLGIELNKWNTTEKGTVGEDEDETDVSQKNAHVVNNIYPGIAYHFSSDNLLDVYAGVEIPIGYERFSDKTEAGDDYSNKTSKFAYHLGLGAFIGIQAYVANLPVAIGVEYGISSNITFGEKFKNESKIGDNGKVVSYTPDFEGSVGDDYSDLTVRRGELGSQFRFTLTYFFK